MRVNEIINSPHPEMMFRLLSVSMKEDYVHPEYPSQCDKLCSSPIRIFEDDSLHSSRGFFNV